MGKRGFTKIIAYLLCFALIFSVFMTGFVALAEEAPPVEDGIIDTENPDEEEEVDIYAEAVDVSTAEELENALAAAASAIRITGDFVLDRTFYVISDTIIYTDEAHTLTRAADFAGDIFVVGQYDDGTVCEDTITLMVGRDDSIDNNMLIIDGNRDNMTAEVVGTVFFGLSNSVIELYANLTVRNCKKVGNERTMIESYNLSYPDLIGGPVAIVAAGKMNIHGGIYENNATNEGSGDVSNRGGAFYFFGSANIYGGTIKDNRSYRGGALYVYRTLNIYGGTLQGNYAAGPGGVAYVPASTAAMIYIEGGSDLSEEPIVFRDNFAKSHGGVFYSLGKRINIDGATFEGNSTNGNGGVIYADMGGDAESVSLNAYNSTFKDNFADYNGGAFYLTETSAYFENVTFEGNNVDATANSSGTRYGGGAFYTTNSYLEINGATFANNSSKYCGGAIEAQSSSQIILNDITALGNSSLHNGGFIYSGSSTVKLYNSAIRDNTSGNQGGAAFVTSASSLNAYLTTFENNSSSGNGGALFFYSDSVNSLLHSCVLLDNTSGNYGGGIYISNSCLLDIYNSSAKGNKAYRGGFLYETTTGTVVTLNGISLSGNTASDGGPIIWGNSTGAKLLINKTTYTDVDYTGTLDDAYWAAAIVNKLSVSEISDPIPGFINYGESEETKPEDIVNPNVTNAYELQTALNAEIKKITILSDFLLDRTFYVTGDTTIYTNGDRVLTRAPHFGGDIFVLGEYANGETPETPAKLTIDPSSEGCSLTIDGNRDNMTTEVVGTVFFVGHKSNLVLRDSLTIKNCYKSGNLRTLNEEYALSYTNRIGGPVIINANSTVDIYGGLFTNNSVLDEGDDNPDFNSTQGGVIYSFGATNIFGGTFQGNHAARGGALYNYRKTYVHNASFIENSASNLGGAVYMAASTACYLYLGASSNLCDSYVLFKDNESGGNGGAILSQGALTSVQNTDFIGNKAGGSGGAIWAAGDGINKEKFDLTFEDSKLIGNNAHVSGGALYLSSASISVKNTDFTTNHANATENSSGNRYGGGAIYSTGSYSLFEGVRFTENSCDYAGGAIYLNSSSESVVYNVKATKNHAVASGGFIHSKVSTSDIYNSTFSENSTESTGGAIALQAGSAANIYSSKFQDNNAENNGGALFVYTDEAQVVVNGCEFLNNNSNLYGGVAYVSGKGLLDFFNNTSIGNSAAKGGYLYITTTGSIVKHSNATIQGNTATDGGPIIWGNSTGAKLYINKNTFTDLDATTQDSAYWTAAIVNKLKVYDFTDTVPEPAEYGNENYENLSGYVEVYNSEELEAAINSGKTRIRIMADFKLDRTFYITHNVTIFATTPYRLTRAENFAGDIFVVGEDAKGKSHLLAGKTAVLTLGNPESATANLLTIDGNSSNMTVPVVGTVLFICQSANANLYNNVSIVNARKEDNKRTLSSNYYCGKYPGRIGGAMAIVESGELKIYGGNYRNLAVNAQIISDELGEAGKVSSTGGAIYNLGEVNIYGGNFEYCKAALGGAIYNYRTLRILNGTFINNYAYSSGGAVYLPSSSSNQAFIGGNTGSTTVTFKGNVAESTGGALYSGTNSSVIIYGDTLFESNQTLKSNGGAIVAYGTVCADNTTFKKNISASKGGAAYITKSKNLVGTLPRFRNCTFDSNEASSGGAITAYGASGSETGGANVTFLDCTFKKNKAKSGGALYAAYGAKLTLENATFTSNTCEGEGGAIYMVYESTANLNNCEFKKNIAGNDVKGYGGAISLHSSFINGSDVTFAENTAGLRGGAIYISYNSASLKDSVVNLKNATFSKNHSHYSGGALYVVDHMISYGTDSDGNALPKEDRGDLNLILSGATFDSNTAVMQGGALFITTYAHAFMSDVIFNNNTITVAETSHNAGAIYSASRATFEIDGGTFTNNSTGANAGAIGMYTHSSAILNNIEASGNSAPRSGGFMHCDTAYATIYNSNISNNSAGTSGGAISFIDLSTLNAYNTHFSGNTALNNGGAVYAYPGASQSVLNGCSFDGNQSSSLGGAIYIANATLLDIYNATATNNHANKGGFLYETTKGSVVKINGLTVSGNTDDMGGPIIWGNTLNAKLFINKNNYVDKDAAVLDDAYWAGAIYNLLTVGDESGEIPAIPTYKPSYTPPVEKEPIVHPEVSVEHIFELAQNADHGKLNSTYAALPKLDNSSNFMSRGTTAFPNICGGTVTVDSFIYHKGDPANNCTVGEGIMIYQAMAYKRANPDEDVSIALSAYRLNPSTAICLDRESPYFGYARALYDQDYDKFGFVRISYLLLCAARMGIDVTVIAQLDGYPNTSTSPRFESYFTEMLDAPCDSAYVEDGVIGDFMTFRACKWQLEGKGGSDMMHTKLCAVSHYLDKDGNVQRNAVWTSSSNLDGINGNGTNALNQLQTATIVSNHADLFRISMNYLKFLAAYCEQEDVYYFREAIMPIFKEQIDLIKAGRENEIPADEQMVYLGGEDDPVFELYFSPFAGAHSAWEEDYNPFSAQLRNLNNSEDSIIFVWNNVKWGEYSLRNQFEDVIINAFHKNKHPDNKIYVNLPGFDSAAFSDLKLGTDIGHKAFNQNDFGHVHSKDVQLSYVKDGQRYYVSLLNSMNVHGGSMVHQSNFALVIKETSGSEGSVFFALADQTTKGIVSHEYEDTVLEYLPEDPSEDGYTYHPCANCDEKLILDVIHRSSNWIVVREANKNQNGVAYRQCTACEKLLETREFAYAGDQSSLDLEHLDGKTFTPIINPNNILNVSAAPITIEATIQLDKSVNGRGGVIVGNYSETAKSVVNLEVFSYGKLRLYIKNGNMIADHIFNTDIRSDKRVNITITLDGTTAKLYVDSVLAETATLKATAPAINGKMVIGGDYRHNNEQYFKGSIYSVNLFNDVRTKEEMARDAIAVFPEEDGYIDGKYFIATPGATGTTFTSFSAIEIEPLSSAPKTLEATVQLDSDFEGRGGVILGNYLDPATPSISLEVYTHGHIRLYYIAENGKAVDTIFSKDIRGEDSVRVAVALSDTEATLYLNGTPVQTKPLSYAPPKTTNNFKIGGDNRIGNSQFFKGTLYSVNLFDKAITQEETKEGTILVEPSSEDLIYHKDLSITTSTTTSYTPVSGTGVTFDAESFLLTETLNKTPLTIEALLQLDKTHNDRAGVIIGNYSASSRNALSLEVYHGGKLRLYFINNGQIYSHVFASDIRSNEPIHIAVTIEGTIAKLYINAELAETVTLPAELPNITSQLCVGGDFREENSQYFKGKLYSINLFDKVRTPQEIKEDILSVDGANKNLLYSRYFTKTNNLYNNDSSGMHFTADNAIALEPLVAAPHTIEATVQVLETQVSRAGVIVGNYDVGTRNTLSLEIYSYGQVRLYLSNESGKTESCIFDPDIRGNDKVHIAVTIENTTASLYLNGQFIQSKSLSFAPEGALENYKIGGDNRLGNQFYFKGLIYNVAMFSDVRTAEEIATDATYIFEDENLLTNNILGEQKYETSSLLSSAATFTSKNALNIAKKLPSPIYTMAAIVQVDPDIAGRAGIILGNYADRAQRQLNLEIFDNGQPRLFYTDENGKRASCLFDADIRSNDLVHIAVVINNNTATLYVNGEYADEKNLPFAYSESVNDLCIGGDNRPGNEQFFKGKIYRVDLFSTAKSQAEIKAAMAIANPEDDSLIYSSMFASDICSVKGHNPADSVFVGGYSEERDNICYTECTVCETLLEAIRMPIVKDIIDHRVMVGAQGFVPSIEEKGIAIENSFLTPPKTIEATIQLNENYNLRAGVIVGNYDNNFSHNQLNLEIYTNGKPRLYYTIGNSIYSYIFTTDIRSADPTHIAVTVEGLSAKLYVNGTLRETVAIKAELPTNLNNLTVGRDNRTGAQQYFAGTIYSVSLFEDVRTAEEIAIDRYLVASDSDGLLYNKSLFVK